MASLARQAINMAKQGGRRQRMVTAIPTLHDHPTSLADASIYQVHYGYIIDTHT